LQEVCNPVQNEDSAMIRLAGIKSEGTPANVRNIARIKYKKKDNYS